MIAAIGQPPAPVMRDVHTRADRNERRYLAWLNSHRAAAEELIELGQQLGAPAFDQRFNEIWDEAQALSWH